MSSCRTCSECLTRCFKAAGSLTCEAVETDIEQGLLSMAAVYEDTLNGCPTRSTNTASINDATSISSTNPRPYRPGPLTPLDSNSASSLPLNSTFDPWSDPLRLSLNPLVLQGPHSSRFCSGVQPADLEMSWQRHALTALFLNARARTLAGVSCIPYRQ